MKYRYRIMPVSYGSMQSVIHKVMFGREVYFPVIVVTLEDGTDSVRVVGPSYLDADEACAHAEKVLRERALAADVTLLTEETYN